jgi:hypothetical protein
LSSATAASYWAGALELISRSASDQAASGAAGQLVQALAAGFGTLLLSEGLLCGPLGCRPLFALLAAGRDRVEELGHRTPRPGIARVTWRPAEAAQPTDTRW